MCNLSCLYNHWHILVQCGGCRHPTIPASLMSYPLYSTRLVIRCHRRDTMWSTVPLRWRHHDDDGVSNHQPCDLHNRLFRRRSKKTSKLRVTGLCEGNSPGPVNSPHKGPVTRKRFQIDDVIMALVILRIRCCIVYIGTYTKNKYIYTASVISSLITGKICITQHPLCQNLKIVCHVLIKYQPNHFDDFNSLRPSDAYMRQ